MPRFAAMMDARDAAAKAAKAAEAAEVSQLAEAKEAPTKVPAQAPTKVPAQVPAQVPYTYEGATAESIGKATVLIKKADTCMEVGSPDYNTDDALDYLVQGTCWRVRSPCYH